MAIYLKGIFLALPQFLSLVPGPADAPAFARIELQRANLFGPGGNDETVGIFFGNELPANTNEHAIRIFSPGEQIFDGPLAFRIAVTGDLDEYARAGHDLDKFNA